MKMRENQLGFYKQKFLATLCVVTAVVTSYNVAGETQKLRKHHGKPLDTGDSRMTLSDEANLFGDKEDYSTKAVMRSRRNLDDRTTARRSLAIVFDVSGSMKDDLVELQRVARTIVDETSAVIENYILVPFADPKIGPRLVTRRKDEFINALLNLKVKDGGDCPELAVGGMIQALEAASPYSTIYVFTDADAKDTEHYPRVRQLVEEKHTPIVLFRTNTCGDKDSPGQKVLNESATLEKGGGVYDISVKNVGPAFTNATRSMLQSPPEVSLNTNKVELLEGDVLELSCQVKSESSMVVQWKRQDQLLMEKKFESTDILPLKIENVTTEHSATYVCFAHNSAGDHQQSAEVQVKKPAISVTPKKHTVNEPPMITQSPEKTIYVPPGGKVVLNCSCSLCQPLTEYIWTNGDLKFENTLHDVQNNTQVNLIKDDTRNGVQYQLTIDDFSAADEGNYTCILSNGHGTDSVVLQVLLMNQVNVASIIFLLICLILIILLIICICKCLH